MKSSKKGFLRKLWVKEPWENIASAVIIVGAFMLLQPYSIDLYKYSFNLILGGTVMFLIVSHFPSGK